MTTHHTSSDLSTTEISVIIPIYNVRDTLRKCIESLQVQTCENWIAICVDDGATDGSGELIDELAANDKRLKVIHKSNGGVSSARNTGLEHVTTPYVTLLDSDDTYEPETLQKIVEAIRTTSSDFILYGFTRINQDGHESKRLFGKPSGIYAPIPRDFFSLPTYGTQGKCYKMSIIRQHQLRYPEHLKVFEDLDYNLRYWSHSKTSTVINEPLYNYFDTETSIMRKFVHGECSYESYEGLLRVLRSAWEHIISLPEKSHSNEEWCHAILLGEITLINAVLKCMLPEEYKDKLRGYQKANHRIFAKTCSRWRVYFYILRIKSFYSFWNFVGWTKKYRVMIKNIFRGKRK